MRRLARPGISLARSASEMSIRLSTSRATDINALRRCASSDSALIPFAVLPRLFFFSSAFSADGPTPVCHFSQSVSRIMTSS